ncbi:hypothetical protein D9M68_537060 [compost metagenome]
MSYIAHARQIPGLERAPFVIVGNEQVLLEQFRQRLLAHSPGHPAFRTSIPESSTVLLHELSAPTPGIILTTPGKLRALRTPHEEHCLLIGLYLHRMQPDLNTSLPNATLIGFTNGPPLTDDTFGEPVASFGPNQAIAAGLLSPLILESRQLQVVSRKTSNAEPTSEDSPHTSVALSILEDIKACSMPSGRKVIVVADKASGARAIYGQLMELLRVSDSPAISSMTLGLASRLLDDKGRQVINHFNNDSTSASVLVIPGDMLMGMDLLDVDAAYITARVNPTLQHKIASLPGRKGALPEIRVVDFGGNNWSVPLMHNLPNNPSP